MNIYERINALEARRADLVSQRDALLTLATTETRDLTDDETRQATEIRTQVVDVDAQLLDLRAQAQADHAAAELRGAQRRDPARVISEPTTYGPEQRHSYFLDLVRSDLNRGDGDGGVLEARARLERHAKEISVDLPRREEEREAQAQREVHGFENRERRAFGSPFERRVNPNRTDGQGGNFVPPLWLIDEFVALARAGRTIANSVRNLTLPGGTDSINLPKIATGTATAIQTGDAAAVQSTDMTDTFVNAPVRTVAGQQDVAMQLIDQSPVSFDEIMFADLLADYNMKLDIQVISGSGAAGQMAGILGAGGNVITYTDAAPTGPKLYVPVAQALSQVARLRFLPATALFSTPARYYWLASQLDSSNRPLVTPYPAAAFNPLALQTGSVAEGPVANVMATPWLIDPNIPVNLGAGTNEDRIIVARTSDLYLWEGLMRTRTLMEVLSGTLQVRLQVYNYAAFMANRYPAAISVISGTGVIGPSGF